MTDEIEIIESSEYFDPKDGSKFMQKLSTFRLALLQKCGQCHSCLQTEAKNLKIWRHDDLSYCVLNLEQFNENFNFNVLNLKPTCFAVTKGQLFLNLRKKAPLQMSWIVFEN